MDLKSRARSEFEESVTCPVCLDMFNDNSRKPKYLTACCHTVCRVCIDRICISGKIKHLTCPVCRQVTDYSGSIDSLPTNHDKLYLLKLDSSRDVNDNEVHWCFTCGKRQGITCSKRAHSVIKITAQLFDNKIPLNMKKLTSRISKRAELIIKHRKEIAERLDQAIEWLNFHQKLVDNWKLENEARIKELDGAVQDTDATINLQTLMMLSLTSNDLREPGTRKECLEEEETLRIVQELHQVERLANSFGVSRNNSLFSLPTLPNLRNILNCARKPEDSVCQWPLLLFEALNTDLNAPLSTPDLFNTKAKCGIAFTPVDSISNESGRFMFQTTTIPSSVVATDSTSPAPVFWFEGVPSSRPATLSSVSKGLLAARRCRKYFNSPLPSGKKS